MSEPTKEREDHEDKVAVWHARAAGYAQVVRRQPVFTRLAERLIDLVPATAREVLDVGAGTGLVSGRLLARRADLRVHLCEPAEGMRALAEARLGGRLASISPWRAEEVDRDSELVDAAVASACLHLSRLPEALRAIAARLRPGCPLAFNFWGSSWAPTAAQCEVPYVGRDAIHAALIEAGLETELLKPQAATPAPIEPDHLRAAARAAGLELEVLAPDEDSSPATILVDFARMDPDLLAGLPEREQVFDRARELALGEVPELSIRFLAVKTSSASA